MDWDRQGIHRCYVLSVITSLDLIFTLPGSFVYILYHLIITSLDLIFTLPGSFVHNTKVQSAQKKFISVKKFFNDFQVTHIICYNTNMYYSTLLLSSQVTHINNNKSGYYIEKQKNKIYHQPANDGARILVFVLIRLEW